MPRVRTTLTLSERDISMLEDIAVSEGLSLAAVIRMAIRYYLRTLRKEASEGS